MPSDGDSKTEMIWRAILLTMRVCVALQCLGNWRWLTQIEETPLLHWMISPQDVGGLNWAEATGLAVQQWVGWLLLLAGAIVLWRPFAAVLLAIATVQTLMTIAMWQMAEGYVLICAWLPPGVLTMFPFVSQTLRIAAPVGLLLLGRGLLSPKKDRDYVTKTMLMLRWVTAIVFAAHGVEAVQHNPKFIDLVINATQRSLGISLSQDFAETCLTVIGVLDIGVAIVCVCRQWKPVMWWIAFWGGLTASSRIVASGWDMSWHATFTRMPHFCVPLAVVLWWHLLKSEPTHRSSSQVEESNLEGSD